MVVVSQRQKIVSSSFCVSRGIATWHHLWEGLQRLMRITVLEAEVGHKRAGPEV